jgi:perosamine synthetase
VTRTELLGRLLADGIATRRGVTAIHEEAAYAGEPVADLSHTEEAARDTLMLPLFPDLTDAQQDYVIDRVISHALALAA